jgi:glucose-6-phosphate dehydrogenase assembly protein OpcA
MTASTANAGGVIPLGEVEQELTHQARQGMEDKELPRLRARLSNLVIYCQAGQEAETVAQAVPDIVAAHPARVLLLVGDSQKDAPLEARVHVWCQVSGRQQLCFEQIILSAGGRQIAEFPFAVRELLIGDLPVNLWWATPTPPPLVGHFLADLADNAQQFLYDSIGWREPMRGMQATSSWLEKIERGADHGNWRVAADLNWRRLRFWRRTLAQALDPNTAPDALESITEVLVEHGPHAVIQAVELVSWLASRLGWQVQSGKIIAGTETVWQVSSPKGPLKVRIRRLPEGPSELRKVRVTSSLASGPMVVNIAIEKGMRLAVLLEGPDMAPRTVATQSMSLAGLVARQLSNRRRDPIFRQSMVVAERFSRVVLQ